MGELEAPTALYQLSDFLCRYYGKKVIILLDDYDTPMQEAYVHGFWEKLVSFIRSLFNSCFKTNPWLERAIMTGITWCEVGFPGRNQIITVLSRVCAGTFSGVTGQVYYYFEPGERIWQI